jgi:Cytidylate kinase-like family
VGFGAVCISSQDGAGAAEASRLVAEGLGFRLIDEDIVADAAVRAGVEKDVMADVERRKSTVTRLLESLGPTAMSGPALMMLPDDVGLERHASDELRGAIRAAIEETAGAGNVVIVSHAASLALAGREDVLRVLITASLKTRQRRVAEAHQINEKEAARAIKRSDAGRADYIKRFYGIAEEPSHYDLVISTDRLTPDGAARVIVHAANGTR